MFDTLSNRLDGIVKKIKGKGRLTEADVDEVMREIRTALLEADVNVTVVRSICNRIREHAIGATRSRCARPRPAGRQGGQRRTDPGPRRRDAVDHLRLEAADRRVDGRPAGLRQDHQLGQARLVVQDAGPPAAARRRRPPASGRRRAAPHARSPDRRAGVLRPVRSGRTRPGPASRRPSASVVTSSSSTPPVACRSTPR